jgi:hypothetical protein
MSRLTIVLESINGFMQTTTSVNPDTQRAEPQTGSHVALPYLFLLLMEGAYILLGALLPLYGLWFHTSLTSNLSSWFLLPTRVLFAHQPLNPTLSHLYHAPAPPAPLSWRDTGLLLIVFTLLFVIYIFALRYIRHLVTRRFLIISLLLFGATCSLSPIVTSTDIFSYITYARLGILYHLNPLTATPMAIRDDPIFVHLYWINQPSAYGPVFAFVTCALQWLLGVFGKDNIAQMVVALRLLGLGAHICSTLLVWSISGHLQRVQSTASQGLRMLVTLAFAWNPLLLLEACINAHIDTLVLLFILLALWSLVREEPSSSLRSLTWTAVFLALATCLKVNIVLLLPGFLLYLWTRKHGFKSASLFLAIYMGIVLALYAPFWQGGALLAVLHTNPGTSRAINTLPEFLTHFYNSLAHQATEADSPAEALARTASIMIFVALYGLLCVRSFRGRHRLSSVPALLRWMTLAWLLYCALGSPWFWPWYTILFFGLIALLAGSVSSEDSSATRRLPESFRRFAPVILLFSFTLLSLYCFYTWAPYATFLPELPLFRWAFLRSLWVWLLPLPLLIKAITPGKSDR